MERLTPQDFDEYQRSHISKEIAENPKERLFVVGCLFDLYFSDNKRIECSHCGIPLFIRPWLLSVAQNHNLSVVCPNCVDPKLLKGQIVEDILNIEQSKLKEKP
jgi:hypothetical protein